MKSITSKASAICAKVGKPDKCGAAALAQLFGNALGPSRKRSFDPTAECVVAAQCAKKKATNQRMKKKTLCVVLLEEKPASVPKGRLRSKLLESGRKIKLQFKCCMKASEVRNFICDDFSEFEGVQTAQYLRCEKNSVMLLNENQELDGDGVIDLAGQGSLYLTQKEVTMSVTVVTYYHAYLKGSLNRSLMKH